MRSSFIRENGINRSIRGLSSPSIGQIWTHIESGLEVTITEVTVLAKRTTNDFSDRSMSYNWTRDVAVITYTSLGISTSRYQFDFLANFRGPYG